MDFKKSKNILIAFNVVPIVLAIYAVYLAVAKPASESKDDFTKRQKTIWILLNFSYLCLTLDLIAYSFMIKNIALLWFNLFLLLLGIYTLLLLISKPVPTPEQTHNQAQNLQTKMASQTFLILVVIFVVEVCVIGFVEYQKYYQ